MTTNTNSNDTKPWYQSSTILAALATGIIALLGIFKINLTDFHQEITDALLSLGAIAGTVLTILGRLNASKPVTL